MNADGTLSFMMSTDILGFMSKSNSTKNRQSSAPARRNNAKKVTTQSVATHAKAIALPSAEDDVALCAMVDEIAGESEDALARFYDVTVSRVYGVALRIVRTPEMAEEVTSDVYMQVWRHAVRYDATRGRVLGWLLIIARSRALDHLRRQEEAFSHPDPHELVSEPGQTRDNPEDLLSASQQNSKLHDALKQLTPLQRQLLSLAFFRGLTHAEIVEHTAMPLGSVKTHIRRALILLRAQLGDDIVPAPMRETKTPRSQA